MHFNPEQENILACEASAFGLGALISQLRQDGSENPVGYASRTLNKAEMNYNQIKKEALACVFGVKRFHSYLYGHHFEMITDHNPLLGLFSKGRATTTTASARIQRWSLTLAAYEYSLSFCRTQEHGNADALSQLPLPDMPSEAPVPTELVMLVEHLNESPVTSTLICTHARQGDPIFSRLLRHLSEGFLENQHVEGELKPYWSRRSELSICDGCIL